ncbi:MAG: DUF2892 domain-containing protein [Gammaproteobacteria bacterium]|nr:DUF2892 domain-containing protein [Gammaproteobacteria bacterium]MBU1414672.1 DUF2892 domain-containing protein [Gammaproteobacteria bacterium]
MKINLGTTDRIIRAILGAALVGATLAGWIGVWGWIGVVLLATAAVSFCPAYALLGMRTCPAPPPDSGSGAA